MKALSGAAPGGTRATDRDLVDILSDGAFHSGEELGERLGVSRAAVWKRITRLTELGLDVEAVRGRGYRIAGGLTLLDSGAVEARAGFPVSVVLTTGSTSEDALRALADGQQAPFAVLAEHQSAGRGRRGRSWVSPLAGNLFLSLAWRFPVGAPRLEGLSLAVGVVIADVLTEHGLAGRVGLKWPNDIWVGGRKIGGVLIELSGNLEDACLAVVGIGINGRLPVAGAQAIEQPWTDLYQETGAMPDRTRLAADMLEQLAQMLGGYAQSGFAAWQARWQRYDVLAGEWVQVSTATSTASGRACGVDGAGALRVEIAGEMRTFHGGEASLRPAGKVG